ncbi:tetratricopeptide repeat protein [uncultured Paraglaciecola sp.]|uniref:tetratricopeptide repeat protein n=1 Tax=uncultured Paraglaciecola sp. TaxID=1765024 RepID=UPI0025E38462|nr:tetratricopeptide repeat protein [uncultured Paraglaciecola sp.]
MLKWYSTFSCFFVLLVSAPISAQISAQQAKASNSAQLEKAYQQVLYEYYQGNFSLALTQMAILEQKFPEGLRQIPDFLSGHKVEPELLKGGMSLAYGLDNQAADIFLRLLKNNATPEVTAFSWLLLGKTYYQKRQFSDAARAFQNIGQEAAEEYFEQSTRDNWLYMQSQLHGFLLDEDAKAVDVQWLEQLSNDSIYRDYVQYNQALALLQKGDNQQAISRLSSLANKESSFVSRWMGWAEPIFSEDDEQDVAAERDAIRDRANLTLGYTLLKNEEPHQAFRVFENIRTEGLDAEAALLGYGWAAAKKNELQTALSIWQRLMQMPQNSEYTLEAYLASAYAYEKAFAPRQSLQVLQLGLQRFEQALDELNQAQQQVSQPQFILGLLVNNNQSESEQDEHSEQLINTQLFNSVAVTSEFRAGLSALQESRFLQQKMQNWQRRMQQYDLMLDERQVERRKRAKQILQNRTLEQLAQLQMQREELALVIDTAKTQQDGQVFMSQQSQKWLDRVKRSEQRLVTISQLKKQLAQPPLADSYQQRVERVAGRLVWQASEAYSSNHWQAQKALKQLDSEIAKAQQRQQQLLNQLAAKPDFAKQRLRVSNLAQRIDAEIDKSNGLQDALVSQLSGIFSQFIQAHKLKVRNYILQAQLAMVRLSDQALQKDNDSTTLLDETSANEENQL